MRVPPEEVDLVDKFYAPKAKQFITEVEDAFTKLFRQTSTTYWRDRGDEFKLIGAIGLYRILPLSQLR